MMLRIETLELGLDWLTMKSKLISQPTITVAKKVVIKGFHVLSKGQPCRITVEPGWNGFIFSYKGVDIPVNHTTIFNDLNGLHTSAVSSGTTIILVTEHLLATLVALGINSAKITLHGANQIPVHDFSGQDYLPDLLEAGTWQRFSPISQNRKQSRLKILEPLVFQDGSGSVVMMRPATGLKIEAFIEYPKPIKKQHLSILITKNSFISELAWARSYIRSAVDKQSWQIKKHTIPYLPDDPKDSPIPVFDNKGRWISPPRKEDEAVRHKILDFLGDLALLGCSLEAEITVIRPGHDFNRKFVQFLGKEFKLKW